MPVLKNLESGLAEDVPQEALQAGTHEVPLIDPHGEHGSAKLEDAPELIKQGYRQPNPEELHAMLDTAKHSSTLEQVATGVEAVGHGVLGPIADAVAIAHEVPLEDVRAREEANPGIHVAGEAAGLIGSTLGGVGLGGVLEKIGSVAKVSKDAAFIAKVASAAGKGAIETALYQVNNETSKMIQEDPNQTVDSVLAHVGMATLLGAGIGGGLGTVGASWELAAPKAGKFLEDFTNRGRYHLGLEPKVAANVVEQPHTILSVENPLYDVQQGMSHEDAIAHLKSIGEDARSADGSYGSKERSIFISNPKNPQAIEDLAKQTGQESIVNSDGNINELKYINGPKNGKSSFNEGTTYYKDAPKDMYTSLKTRDGLIHFKHNISDNMANEDINTIANEYMQSKGLAPLGKRAPVEVNSETNSKIAQAYEEMKHDPRNPKVKASYKALNDETLSQFDAIKKSGIKIEKITPDMPYPYKNSKDLLEDIKNGHMWYQPTEAGFGNVEKTVGHPMLRPSRVVLNGERLNNNDVFRIVHDYFGHGREGFSFGPVGEENAWASHSQMYSKDALPALTAETRGQNSWVNFGPKGAANRANPAKTVFAEQKAGLLPDWAHSIENRGSSSSAEIKLQNELEHPFVGPKLVKHVTKETIDTTLEKGGLNSDEGPQKLTPGAKAMDALIKANLHKTMAGMAGAAAGAAVHHPIFGWLAGQKLLSSWLEKALPALIKPLMNGDISASGFKAAVDYTTAAIQGETLISKSAAAVFGNSDSMVKAPDAGSREKLKKQLDNVSEHPEALLKTGGEIGYYLPDHAQALSSAAVKNVQYLQSLKPDTAPRAPLDPPRTISATEEGEYNRALDIAQNPLIVTKSIKDGSLTVKDIQHLKTMYPSLYSSLTNKLTGQLIDKKTDKGTIPYKTKLSLAAFMGQGLDSSMSGQAILASQPSTMSPPNLNSEQPQQATPSKSGKIMKLGQSYQTTSANRERDRSTRH